MRSWVFSRSTYRNRMIDSILQWSRIFFTVRTVSTTVEYLGHKLSAEGIENILYSSNSFHNSFGVSLQTVCKCNHNALWILECVMFEDKSSDCTSLQTVVNVIITRSEYWNVSCLKRKIPDSFVTDLYCTLFHKTIMGTTGLFMCKKHAQI
jgi:hypothetical protein